MEPNELKISSKESQIHEKMEQNGQKMEKIERKVAKIEKIMQLAMHILHSKLTDIANMRRHQQANG